MDAPITSFNRDVLDMERQCQTTGRACGKCTLCCRVVGVHAPPALDKPPDVPCQHCTPGKGCNIYDHRPR